jgi:hypothetical protein
LQVTTSRTYIFVRIWEGFGSLFPAERFSEVSDARLLPVLEHLAVREVPERTVGDDEDLLDPQAVEALPEGLFKEVGRLLAECPPPVDLHELAARRNAWAEQVRSRQPPEMPDLNDEELRNASIASLLAIWSPFRPFKCPRWTLLHAEEQVHIQGLVDALAAAVRVPDPVTYLAIGRSELEQGEWLQYERKLARFDAEFRWSIGVREGLLDWESHPLKRLHDEAVALSLVLREHARPTGTPAQDDESGDECHVLNRDRRPDTMNQDAERGDPSDAAPSVPLGRKRTPEDWKKLDALLIGQLALTPLATDKELAQIVGLRRQLLYEKDHSSPRHAGSSDRKQSGIAFPVA